MRILELSLDVIPSMDCRNGFRDCRGGDMVRLILVGGVTDLVMTLGDLSSPAAGAKVDGKCEFRPVSSLGTGAFRGSSRYSFA